MNVNGAFFELPLSGEVWRGLKNINDEKANPIIANNPDMYI